MAGEGSWSSKYSVPVTRVLTTGRVALDPLGSAMVVKLKSS